MSCTSPLTVASRIVPRRASSLFSIRGSRWATAAFIASADCSTSATMSSFLLKSRPTSSMPAMSGPLMMLSGGVSRSFSSRPLRSPSFVPAMMQWASRSSTGSAATSSTTRLFASRKCAVKRATVSSEVSKRTASASARSSSGIDA